MPIRALRKLWLVENNLLGLGLSCRPWVNWFYCLSLAFPRIGWTFELNTQVNLTQANHSPAGWCLRPVWDWNFKRGISTFIALIIMFCTVTNLEPGFYSNLLGRNMAVHYNHHHHHHQFDFGFVLFLSVSVLFALQSTCPNLELPGNNNLNHEKKMPSSGCL